MSSLNPVKPTKSWLDLSTILFVIFCSLGCGILLWSAADWFDLMSGMRRGASFCSLSAYWDCDRATLSPVGSFMGIPIGVFGAAWFLMVAFLTFGSARLKWALYVILAIGIAALLFLLYYLAAVLQVGCIVCMTAYICMVGATVTAIKISRKEGYLLSNLQSLLILVLLLFLHVLYTWGQMNRMNKGIPESEFQGWFHSLPVVQFDGTSPITYGRSDAPVQILEFSDFACPFCAVAAATMVPLLKTDPDVHFTFVNYPLDSSCNPEVKRSMHANSCAWAKAVMCAAEQDKHWQVHDDIFRITREGEPLPAVSEFIDRFNVDREKFDSCYKNAETESKLREMIEKSAKLGINSTPTFVFNGRLIRGIFSPLLLKRLMAELKQSTTDNP